MYIHFATVIINTHKIEHNIDFTPNDENGFRLLKMFGSDDSGIDATLKQFIHIPH